MLAKVDRSQVLRTVKPLVHQRHGPHAVLGLCEHGTVFFVFNKVALQPEQTGDDLKVVFDTMMDFFQQCFLLLKRRPHDFLDPLALDHLRLQFRRARGHAVPQFGVEVAEYLLGPLALGYVNDRGEHELPFGHPNRV